MANEARNRRRSAGRREGLLRRAAAEASAAPLASAGAPDQPEGALLSAERRGELLEALEHLRDDDRLVIGCRPGTVKSRLSRALERLRSELASEVPA